MAFASLADVNRIAIKYQKPVAREGGNEKGVSTVVSAAGVRLTGDRTPFSSFPSLPFVFRPLLSFFSTLHCPSHMQLLNI